MIYFYDMSGSFMEPGSYTNTRGVSDVRGVHRYIYFEFRFLQSEKNSGYFPTDAIAFFGRFFCDVPAL